MVDTHSDTEAGRPFVVSLRGLAVLAAGLWPPRRRVLAVLAVALVAAAVLFFRVREDVHQARLDVRMAEAATAGKDFGSLAERAPGLLSLAARQAAGRGPLGEVAALYGEYAEHLPPALLAAAEVELGRNRAVGEQASEAGAEDAGDGAVAEGADRAEGAEGAEAERPRRRLPAKRRPCRPSRRRLRRAQQVDASGVQQLLFDRRGRPLGSIGDDRSVTLEDDLPAGLVPRNWRPTCCLRRSSRPASPPPARARSPRPPPARGRCA